MTYKSINSWLIGFRPNESFVKSWELSRGSINLSRHFTPAVMSDLKYDKFPELPASKSAKWIQKFANISLAVIYICQVQLSIVMAQSL